MRYRASLLSLVIVNSVGCAHGVDAGLATDEWPGSEAAVTGGTSSNDPGNGNSSGGSGTNTASGGTAPTSGENAGASGAFAGGSGGADDSMGLGGSAGTAAVSVDGLSIRYMVEASAATGPVIGSQLWIDNNGSQSIPLNELSLRYYFTNEVTGTLVKNVNWGNIARADGGDYSDLIGKVAIDVVPMTSTSTSADSYVSFAFDTTGLDLKPGYRVKISWSVQNYASQNFSQANDYSYNPGLTTATEWQNLVMFRGANVAWGTLP